MKQEDHVFAECAKLLREKGFDEWCDAYYHLYDKEEIEAGANEDDSFELVGDGSHSFKNSENRYRIGAPTLYEAQKWLRENCSIHIEVNCFNKKCWDYAFILRLFSGIPTKKFTTKEMYETYESALNAGILEALKLINE